ncbi:amino acid ABC transporter permease [Caminicella sporogenes]|uniref:amino acid ABC transporter permease n=1 Tax=Caminicella sporogenes TaxID=166485 RepID=UPI002541A46C|nr:amino acid ABC transporter permease [Caminicella sporogenes]WIF95393.1 amino acid ABC transporter permease [Caminicella sporogenes]
MNLSILMKYHMFYLIGVKNTILLAVFSVTFGLIIGIILSLMKISNNKFLNAISTAYIEFFRGTPLLVQVYIIFYGLPIDLPKFTAGILALSLNSGAYVSEIFRSGIQAIDKGQMEAARSLGMSYKMAMRYIIIPQAIKNVLPALGNEFIVVIKESAIVSVIGIHELMYNAQTVRGNTYSPFLPLFFAALIYLFMTSILSKLMSRLERRLRAGDKGI